MCVLGRLVHFTERETYLFSLNIPTATGRYVSKRTILCNNPLLCDHQSCHPVNKSQYPISTVLTKSPSPQFWESSLVWRTYSGTNETYPMIVPTNFRMHPTYARYITWSKLIVQCVLPVALLVFFNRSVSSDPLPVLELSGYSFIP